MYLVIFALITVWLFYEFYWKRRHLPPGPCPLPFIGNVHQVLLNPPGYEFGKMCKKRYNPIYTTWFGRTPAISICDYELMNETFVKDGDSYTDKYYFNNLNEEFRGGNYGILESAGEQWREHRRFALHQMRDLGLGKMKMEERILLEVEDLTTRLIEADKVDIQEEFQRAVANVINQMIFGYRFIGERREELTKLIKMMDDQQKIGTSVGIIIVFFQWTRKLPYFRDTWQKFISFRDEFFGFFQQQIDQHKNEFDYESEDSTDYVEAYLKEQKKREAEGDRDSFSDIQLKNVVLDLWSAGLSTTTSTLNWGVAYLLNFPEVQDKMHAELDRVIGSSRPVTMNDKPNLPYTCAVIMEMQRALNLLVSNIPHATTRDVQVAGYFLPKGTTVVADIGVLMYDEKLFPNPEKFDPERFLENGKVKIYPEVMPFSLGKRACPGEGLARMELFLIVANLMNRFKLSSAAPPPLKKTFKTMQKPAEFIDLNVEYRFK